MCYLSNNMSRLVIIYIILYSYFSPEGNTFAKADPDDGDRPCSRFTDLPVCAQYEDNKEYYCSQRWMKENCCGMCDIGHSEEDHTCRAQIDIGFIVDSKGSDYSYEKAFIKLLVFDFGVSSDGARAGVLLYGRKPRIGIKLKDHFELKSFNDAVDSIKNGDFNVKSMKNSLRIASKDLFSLKNGARPTMGKILFVISDGINGKMKGIRNDVERLRRDGVSLIVVGIGRIASDQKKVLDEIAGGPGKSIEVESFYKLVTHSNMEGIKEKSCETAMGAKCHAEVDLGFILDSHKENPQKEKNFLVAIAGSFGANQERTRIGAITYNNKNNVSIKLNQMQDIYTFKTAIRDIEITGFAASKADALLLAHNELFTIENGARAINAKVLIILTDGADKAETGAENPVQVANNLRRIGVTVIVIGVGRDSNNDVLDAIAGGPGKYFQVESYNELKDESFLKKLSNKMCRIAKELKCKSKLDIGFVLNSPNNALTYEKMKVFVKTSIRAFGVSNDGSRAGVINDKGEAVINFKDNHDINDFFEALNELSFSNTQASVDICLENAKRELFAVSNGARYETLNVILLFMSDTSKIDNIKAVVSLCEELRMRGIKVMIIGIGELGSDNLFKMAGGKHNVFNIDSYDDLKDNLFLSEITNTACQAADDLESGAIVGACTREEIFYCYGYEFNKNHFCNSTDTWFAENCRFMCGKCNYVPDCDIPDDPQCDAYSERDKDYCTGHWWNKVYCPKMCGLCNIVRPFNVEMMNM